MCNKWEGWLTVSKHPLPLKSSAFSLFLGQGLKTISELTPPAQKLVKTVRSMPQINRASVCYVVEAAESPVSPFTVKHVLHCNKLRGRCSRKPAAVHQLLSMVVTASCSGIEFNYISHIWTVHKSWIIARKPTNVTESTKWSWRDASYWEIRHQN